MSDLVKTAVTYSFMILSLNAAVAAVIISMGIIH